MRFEPIDPPRRFRVGPQRDIELADCGRVYLEADEQVTFVTPAGKQHDFVAKPWGFYVTPSVNARAVNQGFKTGLVRSETTNRYFVMVVDRDQLPAFEAYLRETDQAVVEWLDER